MNLCSKAQALPQMELRCQSVLDRALTTAEKH